MGINASIRDLAMECADRLKLKVEDRVTQMEKDDTNHWLIYRVLGVTKLQQFQTRLANVLSGSGSTV